MSTGARYEALSIAKQSNTEQFMTELKAHQQGKTDYPTFCSDCAKSGVEKWVIRMDKMTCTYFDLVGKELVEEIIPN